MNELFRGALLAGACISIGCVVNLQTGGVVGAVLFSMGLITCVCFRLPLFTGTAGFVSTASELRRLWLILAGNVAGTFAVACMMRYSLPHIVDAADAIATKRVGYDMGQSFILAVFCGFLMTVAVKFAREKNFIPLLFAVPVFILSGFLHSIADAFYFSAASADFLAANAGVALANYLSVVAGNFVGCNLYRIVYWRLQY